MATALGKDLQEFSEITIQIAKDHLLSKKDGFPLSAWKNLHQSGLLGLDIFLKDNDEPLLKAFVAVESLTWGGHHLGFSFSYYIHLITCYLFNEKFSDNSNVQEMLQKVKNGEFAYAMAISEPFVGIHPKYLNTHAIQQGDIWVLNGEKTIVSNGPMADAFFVSALTKTKNGKNCATIFCIPKDTVGIDVEESQETGFFQNSPHARITLTDCTVSNQAIIGTIDQAIPEIIAPFIELESIFSIAIVNGAMKWQLQLLVLQIQDQGITRTKELQKTVGELKSHIHIHRIIGYEIVKMLESDSNHPEFESLSLSFQTIARHFQSEFRRVLSRWKIHLDEDLDLITDQINSLLRLGQDASINKLNKLGKKVFDE
ncbi:MAG: alkylation response protein AidB-like acyl-CoA dehydrogenase [bacterium]|jgi:alkylation response protein AidB-like acyl-CoA dehydrogenase